ncbi:MAG TPA: hypothetical protein VE974_29180 [Thermoanaerobaculia bacterium]|nr:hypothetical protein [Thermoanaerobaculia bacterium]
MKNSVRDTTSRWIGSSLVMVVLTFALAAPAAAHQVPFTATGTAVITGVTHLPGGLTQLDGNVSGTATHLGNTTGPITRVQNHQGNFVTTVVLVGANGTDSVFLTITGQFESGSGGGGGKCVLTSTGTYTVTGGTGSFLNATGSGHISTVTDLCAGTATGTYTGTISQPNSN